MDGVIYLDKNAVTEIVGRISGQIEELATTAKEIDKQIYSLESAWRGNSHDSTISMYESDYKKMLTKDLPEMVKGLNDFIQSCKNAIVETDQQLASRG